MAGLRIYIEKVLVLSAFMIMATGVAPAKAGESNLDFDTFCRKVLVAYPKIKIAHADVQAAMARQMQAKAGYWPAINFSAGYGVSEDPVRVFGMLLKQERFTSADFDLKRLNSPSRHQDFSSGLSADFPLFDALQTLGKVRSARENLKASESEESFTKMEALLLAQDAFFHALTLEQMVVSIDEVDKNSQEDLKKAEDLKDKGMILGSDFYMARVTAGEFRKMKNEIRHQRQAMQVLLDILMDEPTDRTWHLVTPVLTSSPDIRKRGDYLNAAMIKRPDLTALNLRLKAGDAELSREKASALPKISAYGEVTNDRETLSAGGGNNYSVGVRAIVPVFDPARAGRIREAQAGLLRLQEQIRLLKDTIARDIAEEKSRLDALNDNRQVMDAMAADARQALSQIYPLYNEGRKSIADLLNVRAAYLQAVINERKAFAAEILSKGRLLFLSGELNENSIKDMLPGQEGL